MDFYVVLSFAMVAEAAVPTAEYRVYCLLLSGKKAVELQMASVNLNACLN